MQRMFIQGRALAPEEVDWIGGLISAHPEWGRFQLSIHIAEHWNWRNAAGRLKDMAARTLLLKLERRQLLVLPARRRGGGGSRPTRAPGADQLGGWTEPLIEAELGQLRPLRVGPAESGAERQLLAGLLRQYHYLGYQRPVGENLQYLAWDGRGRPVAGAIFGAAAWKCAARDQYVGWSAAARQRQLFLVANNMRLLIPPWVRVRHLASHFLGLIAGRISADWQAKYGHRIYLLETFVDRSRFRGCCYRAANWIGVGQTQGRSRNDRAHRRSVPCKEVYLRPLVRQFRRALQNPKPEDLAHGSSPVL